MMISVVWFIDSLFSVCCISCLFCVFSVFVVLFSSRIGVLCRIVCVMVMCCCWLFDKVDLCGLVEFFSFVGRLFVKFVICVVMVVCCSWVLFLGWFSRIFLCRVLLNSVVF